MKVALLYLNNDDLVSRGVGYVAMAAQRAGHTVDLIDTVWTQHGPAMDHILEGDYDALLISSTSLYWKRAARSARMIKAWIDIPIILGGAHATVMQRKLLEECSAIDYLCVGEGEDFIVEFLDCLEAGKDPSSIRNLAYRNDDGTIMLNPVRPCTDVASLPPFNFELWNPKSVIRDSGNLFPGFCYVFATRGCPYRCSYCCNSCYLDLYGKTFLRTHAIDTVVSELRHLRDHYPIKLAYFGDEMILFDKAYVTELFTRLHDELGLAYGCMFRIEALTPDIVRLLAKTGCRYAAVGIECGDEQFRRQYLNRRGSNVDIIRGVHQLRSIPKLWLTTYNMRGFPVSFDARLTAATKRLSRRLHPNHAQTTWFYPIPGTKLYDYCVERDLIDWEKMNQAEDYFRRSVLKWPISPEVDTPLYG